ncbi:hypothetical protein Plhal304r1_c020g0072541 [Plasmopara halstedii]
MEPQRAFQPTDRNPPDFQAADSTELGMNALCDESGTLQAKAFPYQSIARSRQIPPASKAQVPVAFHNWLEFLQTTYACSRVWLSPDEAPA